MDEETIEGRLLAHRRILQHILRELADTPGGERLETVLRERTVLQDGQEDPGAVEAAGLGIELAAVREFQEIVDDLARRPDQGSKAKFVRPAGPESMREAPAQWDDVDEASDESFPASDPPPHA